MIDVGHSGCVGHGDPKERALLHRSSFQRECHSAIDGIVACSTCAPHGYMYIHNVVIPYYSNALSLSVNLLLMRMLKAHKADRVLCVETLIWIVLLFFVFSGQATILKSFVPFEVCN